MKKFNPMWWLLLLPFFGGMYIALCGDKYYAFEKSIFIFLRQLSPSADIPFYLLTELGSAVGVISVLAIIAVTSAVLKRFWTFGCPLAITVVISRFMNVTIKYLINRPRPDFKVLQASEASFPSGHAQNNMALYIAILLLLNIATFLPKFKTVFKIILVAIPVIIGITRVYFGVHYASDVVAGWSLGALCAIATVNLYFKIYSFKKEKCNGKN